jgi:hypothetical protein
VLETIDRVSGLRTRETVDGWTFAMAATSLMLTFLLAIDQGYS